MHLSEHENYVYVKVEFPDDFNTILDSFWDFNSIEGISVYCEKLDAILDKLKSSFKIVKAAGGIVSDQKKRILVIKRNGFLDLPKGHFKENESPQQAAVREVAEECGISTHSISNVKAKMTYHMYEQNGEKILKETQWFEMTATSSETLVPQAEEGIEEAYWMSENEVKQKLDLFYPSLFDLLVGASQ